MSDEEEAGSASKFVGVEVTSKETTWIEGSTSRPIELQNAVLVTPTKKPGGRVAVQICDNSEENNDVTATVCVLSSAPGGAENVRLGFIVNSRVGVTLSGSSTAGAVVHITGNICDPPEMSDNDELGLGELTEEDVMMLAEDGHLEIDSGDDDSDEMDDDSDESDDSSDDGSDENRASDEVDAKMRDDNGEGKETARKKREKEKKEARMAGKVGKDGVNNGSVVVKKGNKIVTHRSGLKYQELLDGTGRSPKPGRNVAIKYSLRLESGKLVDKSGKQPFKFRLGIGEVVKGMDIGVQSMREGGQRHLIIPPELGYGRQGSPPAIPKNATLFFDVTLVKVW